MKSALKAGTRLFSTTGTLSNPQHWIAPHNQTEHVFREIMANAHAAFHSEFCAIQFYYVSHESQAKEQPLLSLVEHVLVVCLLLFDQSLTFSRKKVLHDFKTTV